MGYTTDFNGEFTLDKPLKKKHAEYLRKFAETRRMQRNAELTAERPDPVRKAAKLPVGIEGGYYVGEGGMCGQGDNHDIEDVINYNGAPSDQPGLWCQWVPNEDGTAIEWDGGEKFYYYVEWLEYLITHFLKPWGYVLNGQVSWFGEDSNDRGNIYVKDNAVQAIGDRIVSPKPKW